MTSSGTYAFNMSNGRVVIAAYRRCQIFAPELRQEHFDAAFDEMNLSMVKFSNLQPNLWKVILGSVTLIQGTATYTIPDNVVQVLDGYVSIDSGTANQVNRYITPMSRTEYAALATPQTPGPPSSYWFNQLDPPNLNFWPTPDGNGPYIFNYYYVSQMQDAAVQSGQTPDLPYLWLDAYVSELASRLAKIYAPQLEAKRDADAKSAWDTAASQNIELRNTTLKLPVGRYYPN